MKEFFRACIPYRGRIIGASVGIVTAILWMLLGFWRTLLLLILASVGCLLGLYFDNREKFRAIIGKIRLVFERE